MKIARTPDDRFAGLPDWPFAPHYADIDDQDGGTLRVAHIDEGPADGPVVLLLHGEPSWSYLYRHIIPPLVAAGRRVIAPDLVGFGRSDKPTEQSDYSYSRHVAWLDAHVFGALDLRDITLFCQDWGGLLGLRLVAAHPERFRTVIAANTALPTGEHDPGEAFKAWQRWAATTERFEAGSIVQGATTRELTPAEVAAYDAPFPGEEHKAGARVFPSLVPTSPDDPGAAEGREAWKALVAFDRPFISAFSDMDPVSRGWEKPFLRLVAGAQNAPHTIMEGAHHFLQEDTPGPIAELILEN